MLDPNTAPLGFGGIVLAVERGIALWRNTRKRDSRNDLREDVRNALTVQQINIDKSLLEFRADVVAAVSEVRQEIIQAVRERRR